MANLSNINNVLRVSSDLRVGINTDAASYALEIGGTNSGIKLKNSGASGKVYSLLSDTSGNFQIYDDAASSGRLVIASGGNATFAGLVSVNDTFKIATNGTATWGASNDYGQLSWDTGYALFRGQSGKGIKLQVNSSTTALTLDTSQNATFSKSIIFSDSAYQAAYSIRRNASAIIFSGGTSGFYFNRHDNSTTDVYINGSGNVGIGVTNPGVKLQVLSASEALTNFSSSVADQLAYSQINSNSSTTGTITAAAALELVGQANASGHGRHAWIGAEGTPNTTFKTKLKFKIRGETASGYDWAGSSEAPTIMTLEGDGNVGIGTSSPQQLLDLQTTLAASSGVGTAIHIDSSGAGGDQAWIGVNKGTGNGLEISIENRDIIFNTGATTPFGGTERMRIASNGAVGIGGANYGTSGQVLTSNGNAAPSWQAAGGGGGWPQEKFAEYTIDSTTSNILVATLNSTTWDANYLAGCLKFTFSTSDYIQVTYLPVSTFLSAGNKLFFKGTEMTTKNNGTNPAKITITFAGNNGSYGSTCTVKLNRNQSESSYTKVNVLIQAISNPNMFILN